MIDLETVRAEFPILQRKTYMNSCSLGALSRRSEAYLHEFTERWHEMGASGWYRHWLFTNHPELADSWEAYARATDV